MYCYRFQRLKCKEHLDSDLENRKYLLIPVNAIIILCPAGEVCCLGKHVSAHLHAIFTPDFYLQFTKQHNKICTHVVSGPVQVGTYSAKLLLKANA
jgi:hypothetical protein